MPTIQVKNQSISSVSVEDSRSTNDKDDVPDLRTAAMMIAVDRVAKSYVSIGI